MVDLDERRVKKNIPGLVSVTSELVLRVIVVMLFFFVGRDPAILDMDAYLPSNLFTLNMLGASMRTNVILSNLWRQAVF